MIDVYVFWNARGYKLSMKRKSGIAKTVPIDQEMSENQGFYGSFAEMIFHKNLQAQQLLNLQFL